MWQIATAADGKSIRLKRSIVENFSGSCILVIHGRCVCAFPSQVLFMNDFNLISQCMTFARPPSFSLAHIDCKMPHSGDASDEQSCESYCRGSALRVMAKGLYSLRLKQKQSTHGNIASHRNVCLFCMTKLLVLKIQHTQLSCNSTANCAHSQCRLYFK